jgi:hypothetical protein
MGFEPVAVLDMVSTYLTNGMELSSGPGKHVAVHGAD